MALERHALSAVVSDQSHLHVVSLPDLALDGVSSTIESTNLSPVVLNASGRILQFATDDPRAFAILLGKDANRNNPASLDILQSLITQNQRPNVPPISAKAVINALTRDIGSTYSWVGIRKIVVGDRKTLGFWLVGASVVEPTQIENPDTGSNIHAISPLWDDHVEPQADMATGRIVEGTERDETENTNQASGVHVEKTKSVREKILEMIANGSGGKLPVADILAATLGTEINAQRIRYIRLVVKNLISDDPSLKDCLPDSISIPQKKRTTKKNKSSQIATKTPGSMKKKQDSKVATPQEAEIASEDNEDEFVGLYRITDYDPGATDRIVFVSGRESSRGKYIAPKYDDAGKEYTPFERELLEACENNKKGLISIAYRMLGDYQIAEQVVQDARINAWLRRETFINTGENALKNWFITIVKNKTTDVVRERQRKLRTVALGGFLESDRFATEPDPIHDVLSREAIRQVTQALSEIPLAFRQVLVLFYNEEFSYAEIADYLGEPITTIRMRIFRAKEYLKKTPTLIAYKKHTEEEVAD